MDIQETEHIIDNLEWSDLDVDESDCVTINEVGRWLEQQGVNVSNFLLLRLVAEESVPSHTMDHDTFLAMKKRLKEELRTKAQKPTDPQEELKKRKAYYLFQWKEYSGSRGQDGELPLSQIDDVLLCECNPTKELLDAIKSIKSDGSESLKFEEFCEMLENLPKSGMIDENTLLTAFQTEDVDRSGFVSRAQLYNLLVDNGSDPLKKEDIDEMMDDCGVGDMFKYTDWIQRVMTIKSLTEK